MAACRSRVSHALIMLSGPLIGIDFRIISWMIGWFATFYLALRVFMLSSMADELMALVATMLATGALIAVVMFAPCNRKASGSLM